MRGTKNVLDKSGYGYTLQNITNGLRSHRDRCGNIGNVRVSNRNRSRSIRNGCGDIGNAEAFSRNRLQSIRNKCIAEAHLSRIFETVYTPSTKRSPSIPWITIALLIWGLGSCDRPLAQPAPPLPSVSPVAATAPPPTPSPPTPSPPTAADRAAANTLRQQGLDSRQQGRYDEAIAALQQSVELDPSNVSGRVILGWTLHLAGQETAAADQLNQVLAQQPNDVPALNALGIVYLVSGDLTAAVQAHQKAVTLQPDNEIGYFNLSLAYHRLNRYSEAIANAQRATQLEPENPHPWIALAIAHQGNSETAQAQTAYQQAVRLDARYRNAATLQRLTFAGFSQNQIQLTEIIRQST